VPTAESDVLHLVGWYQANAENFSMPECGLCPNVGTAIRAF
jgi:hypothetical protein